jgi:hypothetical protein
MTNEDNKAPLNFNYEPTLTLIGYVDDHTGIKYKFIELGGKQ